MKMATITQAKNGLSALIDRVKAGESIVISDRGRAVARLEPVLDRADPDGRLARLERSGIVRVGTAAPPVDLIRVPGPSVGPGFSGVQAVLDERGESW
ncbi:MAG: Antitoxin [Chloroflexi bacterium]|nr:Antitoxin [Chloroflexota bacterium]